MNDMFHPGVSPFRRKRDWIAWKRAEARRKRQAERRKRRRLPPLQGPFQVSYRLDAPPFFTFLPDAPYEIQYRFWILYHLKLDTVLNHIKSYSQMQTLGCSKESVAFRASLGPLPTPFLDHIHAILQWALIYKRRKVLFQKVLLRWLCARSRTRLLNEDDPCTCSPPVKPIHVMDVANRGIYVFEAASLRNIFQRQLTYDNWLFPCPQPLKNPLTNAPFHEGQLTQIVQQLRILQKTTWQIEAFLRLGMKAFKTQFHTPLRVIAVQSLSKQRDSEVTLELFEEFVQEMFDDYAAVIHNYHVNTILWLFSRGVQDPYLEQWFALFQRWQLYETFEESDGRAETRYDTIRHDAKRLATDTATMERIYTLKTNIITSLVLQGHTVPAEDLDDL